jgi:hypothetical protein
VKINEYEDTPEPMQLDSIFTLIAAELLTETSCSIISLFAAVWIALQAVHGNIVKQAKHCFVNRKNTFRCRC